MKITNTNTSTIKFCQINAKKETIASSFNNTASSKLSINKIPTEAIKANLIPTFGKFKVTGKTTVIDRKTGEPKTAIIKREDYGDYVEFNLSVGKNLAGFLHMDCDSLVPEDGFLVTESYNHQPEIKHLRSILGEKYAGIGTELIKVAVQESFNRGKGGNLWLQTETGFGNLYSDYRKNDNPIPFYYKLGFESPIESENYYIKRCINKGVPRSLPNNTLLMLTPEARDSMLEELFENPTINLKK